MIAVMNLTSGIVYKLKISVGVRLCDHSGFGADIHVGHYLGTNYCLETITSDCFLVVLANNNRLVTLDCVRLIASDRSFKICDHKLSLAPRNLLPPITMN